MKHLPVSGIWPLFFTALKKSTTRKDIQRQETRAILCRSTDAGGAPKLRIMHLNLRVRVALLAGFMVLATSSGAFASGQQVWAIDLQARGYDSRSNVRIWFWHHYLVLDPNVEICRALNKRNLARVSPNSGPEFRVPAAHTRKTLVFDIDTHREVSPDVLADADRAAACPQVQGWWWFGMYRLEVPAAWKNSLVRKDGRGGLYVSREGEPDSPLCRACADDSVRWVAPDLLFIRKSDSDKDLSAEVVDLQGQTRYRLDPRKVSPVTNVVFNSTGTRFALFGTYQSGWGHIRYWLEDQLSDDLFITTDRKTVQVFSTSNGQHLFEKTWRKDEADADKNWQPDLKLALSDDGGFLAYFTHEAKVLVYRLASDAAH
jgi:hypothetical protein